MRSHLRMHLLMLFTTLCWGANIVAGKIALRTFDSLALTTLRMLGAAVVLLIAYYARRTTGRSHFLPYDWVRLPVAALLATVFNQLCFATGLTRSSATTAGLIAAMGPVIVLAVSCFLGMESFTLLKFCGVLISFVGVVVLTFASRIQHEQDWLQTLILLAGISSFSCYTILLNGLVRRFDILTLNTLLFVLGTVFLVPFGERATLAVDWNTVPASAWLALFYMTLFGSVIPYMIHAHAMTELTAARVTVFAYLQPLIGVLLAVWILSERIGATVFISGVLILFGLYLAERDPEDRSKSLG